MGRKAISKKVRFEVFKRDGFKCQYCGAHPPGVLLHIDHINPVAAGGGNDIDNLIAACESCNLGKGARSLDVVPMTLREKAALVAEREEQLQGYHDVLEARRDRLESQTWEVLELLRPKAETVPHDWFNSTRKFIEKLGFHEVIDSMEIALGASIYGVYGEQKRFRYFCGVCWNKVRKAEEAGA